MGHIGGACRRDLDVEDRSRPLVALHPDPAADPANELAGDVEPKSGAPDAAGHVRVEAVELLEDPVALCGRDAETAVGDREADGGVGSLQAEPNFPTGR